MCASLDLSNLFLHPPSDTLDTSLSISDNKTRWRWNRPELAF